ncbi:MAG: glutathione S-transferase family protein, partial [Hyphococcus sp.]
MRTLLHMPLDPASRMVRVVMAEKGLPAQLVETPPWEDDGVLLRANPGGALPVLIDEPPTGGATTIAPAPVILEYLEDVYETTSLAPSTSAARAEMRRLIMWFTDKFERDVIDYIVRERIDKRLRRGGLADYDMVKHGGEALSWHLDYFSWLLDQRAWIAGEKMTAADLAGAAYLSALDYVDAVP